MAGNYRKDYRPDATLINQRYEPAIRTVDQIRGKVEQALNKGFWLYDPSDKRWWTPEEFNTHYSLTVNIKTEWLDKIRVLDPVDGLKAADHQIESITSRRTAFAQRIVDYYKNRKK